MLKKILVPIDGTEYSWRAMEYAASLAKLSGGHLVILTVVKPGIKAVGGALWKKNWSTVPMGR